MHARLCVYTRVPKCRRFLTLGDSQGSTALSSIYQWRTDQQSWQVVATTLTTARGEAAVAAPVISLSSQAGGTFQIIIACIHDHERDK